MASPLVSDELWEVVEPLIPTVDAATATPVESASPTVAP